MVAIQVEERGVIETWGLTKRFEKVLAVEDVTLRAAPGEVLALLGPNGAGKTTTVRMLASILKPTAGSARVAGCDVLTQGVEVRRRVGVLAESAGLYARMTGWEYLDFFGELWEVPLGERRKRITALAEQFQIADALPRKLGAYSKGMVQKIALVRTLLHNPPVLLLDEPTSAMDPLSARLVRDTILSMAAQGGHTIVVCTHNLPEVEELAHRIAVIHRGRIIAQGTLDELKARFLGPPLMEVRFSQPVHNGVAGLIGRHTAVVEAGESWVRYAAHDPATVNPAVLHALDEAGVSVLTLSKVPQSLESVYLRVVQEGML